MGSANHHLPLEPDEPTMRRLAAAVVEEVVAFAASRDAAPASDFDAVPSLLDDASVRNRPGERGRALDELLEVVRRAASASIETAGPGMMAYIPTGPLFSAVLGEFLAVALNRYVGMPSIAPACTAIEADVVRWMADLFGLPARSRGFLTTGGSLANFSAMVAARDAAAVADLSTLTVYASEHAHHSVWKAARLAGLGGDKVRAVPAGRELRMDPARLVEAIAADRRAGLTPCAVVATAGTTSTGTIDPLAEIADVAARARVWFHVDAAYGGFFQLTDRGRTRFAGIERADSITLDPPKSLFLPYGTGAVLVRDGDTLLRSHATGGVAYLEDAESDLDLPDFASLSPELSREFRGLRVWLPLQLHGVAAFRDALDEKLDLAEFAYDRLRDDGRFDVLAPPDLSTVAFRLPGGDERNAALLEKVNDERRVFLSSTRLDGLLTLRICITQYRTHRDRVEEALDALCRHAGPLPNVGS